MGGSSSKGGSEKTVGGVVAKVNDLEDGQMKEVEVSGGGKALLIKENGQFYAVSPKCTHYGAPLVKGALCNGRLRCQWHGACFNIRTGDIEDFPGLDSLHTYQVDVSDGEVRIHGKPAELSSTRRVKEMCCGDPGNKHTVLIIGAGGAAASCAEALRQESFSGRIIMATKESCLPYDRTKLSKALDSKPEALQLRNKDFYSVYDIDIRINAEVTKVDTVLHEAIFSNGTTERFDKLVIATGGRPRTLDVPGSDLDGVCYLRTIEDTNRTAKLLAKKRLVIIGSSFIALELASYAAEKASSVTVIGRSSVPLARVFGEKVGAMFKQMHEAKGVKFVQNSPTEIRGESGKVKKVAMEGGEEIDADVVVVAIGVVPATEFLRESGVTITSAGYITVDTTLQTNIPGIYAAGDVTHFPLCIREDVQHANVQHWQMACMQGRIVGANIAGKEQELKSVPFFWTMQYGKSIRYAGYGEGFDDVILHGEPSDGQFVAFYTKGSDVVATATLNSDPLASQYAELVYSGKKLTRDEVLESKDSWVKRLD